MEEGSNNETIIKLSTMNLGVLMKHDKKAADALAEIMRDLFEEF